MKLKGTIKKEGKFWAVSCPALQADTQGTSRKDGLEMIKDWIRSALDQPDFPVEVDLIGKDEFSLSFKTPQPVLALMLERTRALTGLTLQEIADKIGTKSRSAVKAYETGKHDPGFFKAQELFNAMGFDLQIELVPTEEKMRA